MQEVTVTFWQIAAHTVDAEKGTVEAVFLGSYVMHIDLAKQFARVLATNIGLSLVEDDPSEESGKH
jgi:hypothetical protein